MYIHITYYYNIYFIFVNSFFQYLIKNLVTFVKNATFFLLFLQLHRKSKINAAFYLVK